MKAEIKEFIINVIITGLSAAVAKTVIAPLERMKLILQNQEMSLQVLKNQRATYSGILDMARRLPREQGFLSFWRGNGVNIIRYIPSQSLNFAFNDLYKQIMYSFTSDVDWKITVFINFISGGLAGFSSACIVYPLDFCQTKLVADIGTDKSFHKSTTVNREYYGLNDCLKRVYKIDGIKGYYSGLGSAIVGMGLYRSLYFGIFDFNKIMWSQESKKFNETYVPFYISFIMAQCAGITASCICYPFDTVMRRMMINSGRTKAFKRNLSTIKMFKAIYKKNGIKGFYKGIVANCLRSTGGVLVLVFYDQILYYTNWKKILLVGDR